MKVLTYLRLRVAEHTLKRLSSEIAAARDYRQTLESEYHWALDDAAFMRQELKEVEVKMITLEEERDYLEGRIASLKAGDTLWS